MLENERRKVGDRGQVTIPKELRERFDIQGGDEVIIREEDGKITIVPPVNRQVLAKGYQQRAERARELAEEVEDVSREADEALGDPPEW